MNTSTALPHRMTTAGPPQQAEAAAAVTRPDLAPPSRRRLGADRRFAYDVAVVGLGYVGLPTALAFHAAGCRVLGVDTDADRLTDITGDRVDLLPDDRRRLAGTHASGRFDAIADLPRLAEAHTVIVCVPTPVDDHLLPDLTALRTACGAVVANAVPGQVVILTSTTFVGSTRELLTIPLTARGLVPGADVHVAFSPERIDPGNARFTHEEVPRVVGGATQACTAAAVDTLSRYAGKVHIVSSPEAAEMSKLLENTFRAVNIALANEFAEICRSLDVDVIDVITAAATKPYGFMPFYPGPGVGGHCIPCDPHYLLWQLRRERLSSPVIETAMSSIACRPAHVVERARHVLADAGRGVAGSRVLVVGVAYKPGVADLRQSPALEILRRLRSLGAVVGYTDALFPRLTLPDGSVLTATDDPAAFHADLVILHTAHDGTDLSWAGDATAVLDTSYRLGRLPHAVRL